MKLNKSIILYSIILLLSCTREEKKIRFVSTFMDLKYAVYLVKYADMYGNEFKEEVARVGTESEWDRFRIGGHKETGYYQILPATARSLITLAKRVAENPNDKHELNIIMGNIHIAAMRKYNEENATEIYNIGIGKFRAGKKHSAYLERYYQRLAEVEAEWRKFK